MIACGSKGGKPHGAARRTAPAGARDTKRNKRDKGDAMALGRKLIAPTMLGLLMVTGPVWGAPNVHLSTIYGPSGTMVQIRLPTASTVPGVRGVTSAILPPIGARTMRRSMS